MDKSCHCETCRQWTEHHYWDILDDRGKCFFKVIMDDLPHQMTIPDKFAQHFKGKISRTVKLEARNGSICDVAVKTCYDQLILHSGWEEFFNKNDLKRGDFLVFRYDGDSQFKVEIFDPTGCEKASSCMNINNPRSTEIVKSYYEHHSRPSLDNSISMETSSSSIHSEEPGDTLSSEDDLYVKNVPPYMTTCTTYLTPMQKDKVEEIVQAINSDSSILVSIMCKTSVGRRKCKLGLPKKYADAYLPQEKQIVVLQRHDKRWKMSLNAGTSATRNLVNGWRQFAHDNNLQIGDICLFDRLDSKKVCKMNVHIIRAKKRVG